MLGRVEAKQQPSVLWSAVVLVVALLHSAASHAGGTVAVVQLQPQAQESAEIDPAVESIYAALDQQRKLLGLPPLRRNVRLELAAAAQVKDSVEQGYFATTSPDGKGLEMWVTAEGYQLGRVTEKLAEANLRVTEIAAGWLEAPERNGTSLFHPNMLDVGVGLARLGQRNRIVVILGITDADLVRGRATALLNADAIELEFLEHFNALRAQASLKPMKAHLALRHAAAELASEILDDQLEPNVERRAFSMARRIRRAGYRMREALELQAVGPTSVDELVAFWFADADSQVVLLKRFFTEFGLAVRVAETDDGPTVVWVLSVGRAGPL